MSQLHSFSGNVALPLDGRLGFGIPAIGGDEPTGPQLLAVAGDPNGVVTAPIGTLALDFGTPSLWQNIGGTTWVLAGGNASVREQVIVSNTPVVLTVGANALSDNGSPLNPVDGPTSFVVPADGDYVLDLRSTIQSLATP